MAHWKDEFLVLAYEHAKAGLPDAQIAKALDSSSSQFYDWKESKPALAWALERGRAKGGGVDASFADYCYDQLPAHLKQLWDDLCSVEDGAPQERLDAILRDQGKAVRQHLFIHALIACNFNESRACKRTNTTTRQLRAWREEDPGFAELIMEFKEHRKNFYEESLVHACMAGEASAIIFANKTLNADRGYADKSRVDVNISGQVNVNHIDITDPELGLPIEVLMQIRDAHRALQAKRNLAAGVAPRASLVAPGRVFDAVHRAVPTPTP